MSFLSTRMIGRAKEGAYFAQQSKVAVSRMKEKIGSSETTSAVTTPEAQADVLPEILSHSLPSEATEQKDSSLYSDASLASSSVIARTNKEGTDSVHPHHDPEAINPLNAVLVFPKATFGPKRWHVPTDEPPLHASTANEMRQDHTVHFDSENTKNVLEGYVYIGKAFAIATGIVFGGAALLGTMIVNKFDLHSREDIRREGKLFFEQKVKTLEEQLTPLKTWVEEISKK
eukprot:TRINITY_DN2729_c0_g1_i1.p1 TRINITY_DN2729_c0_g1~~TRINITY_DN2729_c0_g1_i1.p1  ORF type:complete len:230 (-),score=50.21 TRINITY_DN2729_c0_g1_i1:274-963(-)